jgi:F-type H+-transporting ATPase subunit delta
MSGQVAARYGKSLLQLATESKSEDRVFQEMISLGELVAESDDLKSLLQSPIIKANDKKAILAKVLKDFSSLTNKFVALLVDKGRENSLSPISQNYIQRYREMKGMAIATVRSAVKLDDKTLSKVEKYLKSMLGKEDIDLTNEIDPDVLGGMVIQFEDKVLDLSVARELKEYRKELIYN